ncbi:ATP-dependent zinc metalloprotease FtsH 1 [[Clostridium] cellulosi]|uniref:ATP-dependent zinc metalloprotease FtsH n=1 Tax=[Clostridium] cellulosi TaxID=29343 RepID=A0A078KJL6_9FIRM|nr:ATP-dependent zinc metalloprotease FtsH 1 [[Clostridium] cellulosi]
MNKKNMRGIAIYIILIIIGILALSLFNQQPAEKKLRYSTIVEYFETNNVKDFTLDLGSGETVITLRDNTKVRYTVPSVEVFLKTVEPIVEQYNEKNPSNRITYDYIQAWQAPWWFSLLPWIIFAVAMIAFWVYIMNQTGGAGGGKVMSFGKARIKQVNDEKKRTTFDDVAGEDEEKEELQELVEFLKNPRKFNELGARIPKGVLLIGPPGTGKTLLAKAVAGEAGVPFFSISGSDFVEMFVGVGASRVRDLFDQAKKNSPCIIFIDEIDAVGRHRGAGLGGGHDEREQTLNQLLVEMDGFGANEGVIIIAATNRPDILDPALLRPGRFDRQVYVGVPDIKGREAILKVHAKGKPLASDVNLKEIAKTTVGFTGADIENLLNEAALLAARRGKKEINMAEIEEATVKVIVGPEKRSRIITEREKRITAFHEAGHAVVTRFLPTQNPVQQISIIPRGRAGGFTLSPPVEDRYYNSKTEMFEEICTLLGGRVAESIAIGDISTGASNDIERATNIARKMVTAYGMSERLGPIVYGSEHDEVFLGRDFAQARNYSENVAAEIDSEIKNIIDEAYEKTRSILQEKKDKLYQIAQYLFTHEKMSGEEFEKYFAEDDNGPGPVGGIQGLADAPIA